MSTLAEELEGTWQPLHPAVTVPPLEVTAEASNTLAGELEASWGAQPAPTSGPLPGISGNIASLAQWVAKNPQQVADMLIQGGFTAAGITAGTMTGPAAPIAAPALGAGGNVLGKQISRRVGEALGFPDAAPPPDLASIETGIDAGLGAIGPVAGSVARTGSRIATGLRQGPFNRHVAASDDAIGWIEQALSAGGTSPGMRGALEQTRAASRTAAVEHSIGGALTRASERAAEATTPGATLTRGAGGGLVGALLSPEPITGALLGAGVSEAIATKAVPALLNGPNGQRFARWALNVDKNPSAATLRSLTAIFAGQSLTPSEREAVSTLTGALSSERAPVTVDRLGRPHDARGRFTVGGLDHTGHPALESDDDGDDQ